MQEDEKKEIKAIEKAGKIISEVTSRALAPLIGLTITGPIGAIAGGVAGTLIKFGLEEFMGRWLTPKEVKRVGTTAEYIINGVNNELNNGMQLNQQLFEYKEGEVSNAEELFEGVLSKCKNEYQEKKLKYISNIFISSAFDESISGQTANQILIATESMSFRKLCILALYGKRELGFDVTGIMLETYRNYENAVFNDEHLMIRQDVFELVNLGFIENRMAMFGNLDIVPGLCRLTKIGSITFKTLKLESIEDNDIYPILNELKYQNEFGLNKQGGINTPMPGM